MSDLLPPLERLGLEVERVAHAADDAKRARGRRRRRPPLPRSRRALVIALLLLLLAAAAAIAASGWLTTGEPVKGPDPRSVRPDAGLGATIAGSERLTALRVADPAGGPPWGVRTLRTTRGLSCVQVGRVVAGRLGVLGRDGAFHDDRRFHALPASSLTRSHCGQRDGAGNAFLAVTAEGLPASGLAGGCLPPGRLGIRPRPRIARCATRSMRALYFGTLGPQAKTYAFTAVTGREVRAAVAGPQGAYLVVRSQPTVRRPNVGATSTPSPGAGVTEIRYRDGSTCRPHPARAVGGRSQCPLKGYVEPAVKIPRPEQTRAPIDVSMLAHTRLSPPSNRHPRIRMRHFTVSFRVPVATPDPRTFYFATYAITPVKGSFGRCNRGEGEHLFAEDLAAGELVSFGDNVKAGCTGTINVTVLWSAREGPVGDPRAVRPMEGERLVGRAAFEIPPLPATQRQR